MCLLDCDKFKNVNDTYGHVVGDAVIIAVARSLQSVCREHDICMRLGGDEFVAVLLDLPDVPASEVLLQRLLNAASPGQDIDQIIEDPVFQSHDYIEVP